MYHNAFASSHHCCKPPHLDSRFRQVIIPHSDTTEISEHKIYTLFEINFDKCNKYNITLFNNRMCC